MAETATMQAEAPVEEHAAEPAGQPSSTGGTAILRERFLIDGGEPLPDLDSPSALAYAAHDRRDSESKLYAVICQPGMPVRTEMLSKLKDDRIRGMIPVVEWGAMDWPVTGQRVMAIVFERPMGGRLTDALESKRTKISEYDAVRRVLEPAMTAITTLNELGMPHRAIRPDNLFFMTEECQDIVLGDCFSTPSGFDQPVIFETIPRSMATPAGRGTGSVLDDLYALGVSMVFTLLGFNPARDIGEMDLLSMKIERGSYASVCGNSRLPLSMIEVLRGLLTDDESARWSPEEVETWMDGRKRTPIQRHGMPKANAPYMFQGHPHISPITLAFAFSRNIEETIRTLKSDETFDTWLRKNLEDEELADRLKGLVEQAALMDGSPSAAPELVVSRICMLLDPSGPIRFRNMAFMPDSLGQELAIESVIRNNSETMIELITKELFETWIKAQPTKHADTLYWQRSFTRCRNYLKAEEPGFGIERCLYEYNSGLPCQSPLIKDDFVIEIEELLPALDRAANKADANARPVDRHIAAFIAARFNEDIHLHLKAIASPEEARRVIGTLSLLAFLQWKLKTASVLGLASWLGGLLGPAINTYNSRSTRRELEKEIPQLVRKGSLPELFDLIDNAERRQRDQNGFAEAQAEFMKAETEILDIDGEEGERDERMLKSGQKTTAMLSILLAMTIISMIFLLDTW